MSENGNFSQSNEQSNEQQWNEQWNRLNEEDVVQVDELENLSSGNEQQFSDDDDDPEVNPEPTPYWEKEEEERPAFMDELSDSTDW